MTLSLKLLGAFALRDGSGADLSLPTRKTRALLGYLAVNADRPQPRERLMALLWSDRSERQARQSLNQALLSIRKLADGAGAALIDSDTERVTLQGDAVDCDVERLRSMIADNPAEAADLYDGPFLDGMSVPDPAFEDWLLATRSELHTLACDALEAAMAADDTDSAVKSARRLVTLDPLREDAHRRLMQLLRRSGDRAGALRQYQACAEILQRELQVEPDAATKALFETIRQDSGTAPPVDTPSEPEKTMEPPRDLLMTPGPDAPVRKTSWPSRRLIAAAIAVVLLVSGAGIAIWLAPWRDEPEPAAATTDGSPLSGKPSVAVLPFKNMSDDPKQEYFSDGMTDDLITDLSKVSGLFVIARHSSFAYKNRNLDLRVVGRELGVHYVLEGSVRRFSGRVRINAQLIDARTGGHVWAERFDGDMTKLFALQDTVNRKIVSALAVSLTADDRKRIVRPTAVNPDAYDALLQGIERMERFNPADIVQARELFKKAAALDTGYARAFGNIARTYAIEVNMNWTDEREEAIRKGLEYATKALAIDDNVAQVHLALSSLYVSQRRYDDAIVAARRTVQLRPNDANSHAMLAFVMLNSGMLDEALGSIRAAERLNPIATHIYLFVESTALFLLGRYSEAIPPLETTVRRNPAFDRGHLMLAAAYALSGNQEKARWSLVEALALRPGRTLTSERRETLFKRPEDADRYIEGLRKAGLPE